jgi:hypothetical protein
MLVVMSILLALGVREWQDSRVTQQLINRSLESFERELTQNKNRIEALYPYHVGLQSILAELQVESHPDSERELRNVLNGFQSAVLLTTAWDTALATGALSDMDYELVYALSLTYSLQDRFRTLYNSGLIDLLNSNTTSETAPTLAYAASRYVNDITTAEGDLLAAYQEALEQLQADGTPPAETTTAAADESPPN